MPVTVVDALQHARDAHPAFTRTRVPDPVLIRALERYAIDLIGILALECESALLVRTSGEAIVEAHFTTPPYNFAAVDIYAIAYAPLHILSVEVRQGTVYIPVEQVLEDQQHGASKHPACYIRQSRYIFPLRSFASWQASGFADWRVRWVQDPRPLALKVPGGSVAQSTVAPLPDDALPALAAYLSYCAARKVQVDGKPVADVDGLRERMVEVARGDLLRRKI